MSDAMSIPTLGADAFASAAKALFPPGDAWRALGLDESLLDQLVDVCVASLARVHARTADLTEREADPAQAVELLPDWEAAYGLPDPCSPVNASINQRQNAVVARIASTGGQSESYFLGVAKALGYDVTIDRFDAATFGHTTFGAPMNSTDWRYAWQVNTPNVTVIPATFGHAAFGDPFETYSDTQLACVLGRLKPAYSILIMNYEGS